MYVYIYIEFFFLFGCWHFLQNRNLVFQVVAFRAERQVRD